MSAPTQRFGLNRRHFLQLSTLGLGIGAMATLAGCAGSDGREPLDTVGQVDFRNPLHVPPLAPAVEKDGQRVFDLVTEAGQTEIVSGGKADTWGVNGAFLGPTLRVRRGEEIRINVSNALDEPTTLHWHGMRLPAAADGGPHQMVEPGATWSPSWTIDQPAATLWYHPHPHGQTERHVYKGLGGMFLIDDDEETALNLPRDYGVDDIPLIVQDKTFSGNGQLVETGRIGVGMLGGTVLVNGTAAPVLDVVAEHTRLRLLNASSARSYNFGFSDDRTFTMIASDGGLLTAPAPLSRIMLTPGERAEIIVTAVPGETVTLRSYSQDLGVSNARAAESGSLDTLDIIELQAASVLMPAAPIPAKLGSAAYPDPALAGDMQMFQLGDNVINSKHMDMDRIDLEVKAGSTQAWAVFNAHNQPHNFHIHDVQFQILTVDNKPPPPELAGWKDTVYVPPGVTVRLLMQFGKLADPVVPYMYHCHLLWHEDMGMMGQFLVVDA
ncbi:multicopper oxidase family protein [Arthrobacter sp. PAMC 25486]|uniref:multicopper oxidase family protein n=1 Tax=Arthrobacter sp. PAMC 25486 TaxID=1494608 RepID=UPI00056F72CD|nr:multicopper oxidase domain-containing protein [Arthrobacter sp. PAMC 25486]